MMSRPCVLYFYPMDFSVGCTNEACGLRDTFEVFSELNIKVIGIRCDSIESHLRFKKTLSLPFDLLSDRGGKVCADYKTRLPLVSSFTNHTTYLLNRSDDSCCLWKYFFIKEAYQNNDWTNPPCGKDQVNVNRFNFENAWNEFLLIRFSIGFDQFLI